MSTHVYRTYSNLDITVCQNCAKFKSAIEKDEHHIYEHGYCDADCPRCAAEVCVPVVLELIQTV